MCIYSIIDIYFFWLILFCTKNELLIQCGEITLLTMVNSFMLALDFFFLAPFVPFFNHTVAQ